MSGELAPDRRGLRASHEDREHAVDQLRMAAGDGRITPGELDERLERALTARTYGDLDALLADLPSLPHGQPAPGPPVPDVVEVRARGGRAERVGPWVVPRRMEVEIHGGTVTLDFTRATVAVPALDLVVDVHGGKVALIVPPGVAVEPGSMDLHGGRIHQRAHQEPGTHPTLLIGLSGSLHGGTVVIRPPRQRGRWGRVLAWLLGRRAPLPPGRG